MKKLIAVRDTIPNQFLTYVTENSKVLHDQWKSAKRPETLSFQNRELANATEELMANILLFDGLSKIYITSIGTEPDSTTIQAAMALVKTR